MTIDKVTTAESLTAILNGRLDSMTSDSFSEWLKTNFTDDTKHLILDFSGIDFISSKGLRVLITVYKSLNGRTMEIINANDSVLEVFRLSGLLNIFTIK